jgi:hypothetical protein
MNTPDRGLKHVCSECEIKFYDLGREVVTCPKCGAKPLPAKAPRKAPPAKKISSRTTFGRFP